MIRLVGMVGEAVLQPVRDVVDVCEGLSDGEIRTKAIARLGADVVAGMALSEMVDTLHGDK